MGDRELLEMAAKALGGEYRDHALGGQYLAFPANWNGIPWDPLKNDGDALRLAAKLMLSIKPGKRNGDGCSVDPTSGSTCSVTVFRDSKDMAEQMRYAIVHAAAEIGKAMP